MTHLLDEVMQHEGTEEPTEHPLLLRDHVLRLAGAARVQVSLQVHADPLHHIHLRRGVPWEDAAGPETV